MGVKLLIRTQPAKGISGPAHYDILKRLVDELCASQLSGRSEAWAVTCQLLKQGNVLVGVTGGSAPGAAAGPLRDTWAVSFRDAPDLVYLLLRPDNKVLECESAVMRLLEKKLEYSKQMAVRLEGHTFSKGDFLIRLCTVTQAIHSNQALLGHCLEVEYQPASCIASAEGMLAEFVDLLRQHLGQQQHHHHQAGAGAGAGADGRGPPLTLELVKPGYDKYGLSSMSFGRAHAAVAYSDLAVAMLTSSAAAAAQQQQQQQQQQQANAAK